MLGGADGGKEGVLVVAVVDLGAIPLDAGLGGAYAICGGSFGAYGGCVAVAGGA